jgi:ribosomal protein S18 acetylase RimI-like enzyme
MNVSWEDFKETENFQYVSIQHQELIKHYLELHIPLFLKDPKRYLIDSKKKCMDWTGCEAESYEIPRDPVFNYLCTKYHGANIRKEAIKELRNERPLPKCKILDQTWDVIAKLDPLQFGGFHNYERYTSLVAYVNEKIVAYLTYSCLVRNVYKIEYLGVHINYRKLGYGTALIRELKGNSHSVVVLCKDAESIAYFKNFAQETNLQVTYTF